MILEYQYFRTFSYTVRFLIFAGEYHQDIHCKMSATEDQAGPKLHIPSYTSDAKENLSFWIYGRTPNLGCKILSFCLSCVVGGIPTPLKNISQVGWLFPIYGKIKNMFQTTNQLSVKINQFGSICRTYSILFGSVRQGKENCEQHREFP